ncbi:MAG: hypothetical protein M1818_004084 [Claussenomyces sp. TS43310]|nr:MAG: hypothetical protein M1818_004084 [Claussenomyces sp. TS43310]
MEPYSKKRRLAPKLPDSLAQDQSIWRRVQPRFEYPPPPSMNAHEASTPAQSNSEIDTFARHLQDAASMAYTQANRPQYNSVTVLLLHWEDDPSVEAGMLGLEAVFRERYNYRIESWSIPSCPNPSTKLLMHMARHIEHARPGHLLIIYYAGHSFTGADHNTYWACNSREDSSKLKWDAVKCLLEDAQPDILLLLDCGFPQDAPVAGRNGVKQGIAAFGRENSIPEYGSMSFTYSTIDALHNLSSGPPFSVQRLQEEIMAQRHIRTLEQSTMANGNAKSPVVDEKMPIAFTLTPGTLQTITLAPLVSSGHLAAQLASPVGSSDGADVIAPGLGERSSPTESSAQVLFDEARALVSFSFSGEHSQELASFKDWLNSPPATSAKVTVEGMFHGSPILILVSMPIALWNAIKNESGLLLGYIRSHNVLRESRRLEDVRNFGNKATVKDFEDGKMLLEAREAAISSPALTRHEHQQAQSANIAYQLLGQSMPQAPANQSLLAVSEHGIAPDRKEHAEDSDEMHEAAIQLKALSHVRPSNHEDRRHHRRSLSHHAAEDPSAFPNARDVSGSSPDAGESGGDDQLYSQDYNSSASRPKARRSLQKQGPKQDTRCSMCSHAPFKDSSSLRKHVAAAHTRPFPCAFSFAGCTSTFGSKNEWKRHISSQHLCLTYYRCSSCPQSTIEGKGNEFNRKDLFTQHLRRMHAPFAIKKAIAKGDSKLQLEWETHVKEMQASCLVIRRSPPQRSACPKSDCSNVFEGTGSWDDWTEHVGRHMEKGEASRLGVDKLLARWALDEGIIERKEDGEYKLCGSDRENNSGGYYSDGASKMLNDERMEDVLHLAMDDGLR